MKQFSFFAAALSAFSLINATPISLEERQINSTVVSESAENPIGESFPGNITGTLNGTIIVVPIAYSLARTLIPEKFNILTKAYQEILSDLPKDQYPLIIRSQLDHDVGLNGTQLIPDFQTVHVSYPFVDLLGDGYSSFSFQEFLIMSADNPLAIAGVEAYTTKAVPSTFRPNLQAYAFTPHGKHGEIFYDAYAVNASKNDCPIVTTKFTPQKHMKWPMEIFVNVTNQPAFTDGDVGCDNQIFMYNTTISTGVNAPVPIKGDISVKAPFLRKDRDSKFHGVEGIKVDVAFLENNLVPCRDLKGYHGTGVGDRGKGV